MQIRFVEAVSEMFHFITNYCIQADQLQFAVSAGVNLKGEQVSQLLYIS